MRIEIICLSDNDRIFITNFNIWNFGIEIRLYLSHDVTTSQLAVPLGLLP